MAIRLIGPGFDANCPARGIRRIPVDGVVLSDVSEVKIDYCGESSESKIIVIAQSSRSY
eukprot:CAMPEP_0206596098 /NCGR_PEP_ID=MMETSP0325_2-20121206/43363_1 /ASSEMBLY_ACC=CAM_ASM_000347 /TAXON_ID=2866 /ORGANISM="Crypthecodinium cohnii, Strain Seligo" /LENGTH=58 /DNA_ID=CAMNT_0054106877 /DNA_START=271 /DNA_END=447 /DNA_ORIENTATION=-